MTTNYIAFGIYLLILGLITWYSSKERKAKDFLYASHEVGWKNLSLSVFSTVISSYNVVVTLTFAYLFGPYVIVIFLGVFAAFAGIYYIAKKDAANIKALGYNNIIDFFAQKFDNKTATALNLSFIAVLFFFITFQFFINTTLFMELMNWGKYLASVVVGIIVLTYISIGGLKTGIYTDVFQGLLMFILFALVFMIDTSEITSETVYTILTDTTIIIGAISLAIAQFLTLLVQPEMWQRVIAARSVKDMKKGFIMSSALITVFVIPLILIGLVAHTGLETEDPSTLFYDVISVSTPEWFLPFLTVGIFAAFMSTLDSSLFAITSQIGKYGLFVDRTELASRITSDAITTKKTRISLIVVMIFALFFSLFVADFIAAVFGLVSILTVLSIVILSSLVFRVSSNELLSSIIVGVGVFIVAQFGGFITDNPTTILYPSIILTVYILFYQSIKSFKTGM